MIHNVFTDKQFLKPQKGILGPHSFKLINTLIVPSVTSWRSGPSNKSLVVLKKLLFVVPQW